MSHVITLICAGAREKDGITRAKVAVERHGGTVVDETSSGLLAANVSSLQTLLADLGPNWTAATPKIYKVPGSRPQLNSIPH